MSPRVIDLIRREKKTLFRCRGCRVRPTRAARRGLLAKHVLSNTVIFLLKEFGSLDLSLQQMRCALPAYRTAWLTKFSAPLSVGNIEAMRELGVAGHHHLGPSQEEIGEWQSGGLIIVVPGPISVLNPRKLAYSAAFDQPFRTHPIRIPCVQYLFVPKSLGKKPCVPAGRT